MSTCCNLINSTLSWNAPNPHEPPFCFFVSLQPVCTKAPFLGKQMKSEKQKNREHRADSLLFSVSHFSVSFTQQSCVMQHAVRICATIASGYSFCRRLCRPAFRRCPPCGICSLFLHSVSFSAALSLQAWEIPCCPTASRTRRRTVPPTFS